MIDSQRMTLAGGRVLRDGQLLPGDLHIADGRIVAVPPVGALRLDCARLTVLPGMIDVHGDAFERELMPRPGVMFPLDLALAATDRQLVAAGITTACHGLTLSWEPGLRSLENSMAFVDGLYRLRPMLAADHRLQLRWETFCLEAIPLVERWLALDPRPVVALNDHTAATVAKIAAGTHRKLAQWAERAGLTVEDYRARLDAVWQRRDEVPAAIARLAGAVSGAGAILLSHDERTLAERARTRALGATLVEFPLTPEVAADAVAHGEATVLGAPNVVRGGSHTGALDARDAVRRGLCTVLASDYYYPSLLAAVARLVREEVLGLGDAWALVAGNPARALGLSDRGVLAEGRRADVIAVDWRAPVPRVVLTLTQGRIAHLDGTPSAQGA